jgi:hypothetical protein
MSKLFIDTFNQHGGKMSDSDAITALNTVSKQINKKMKIIEYKYGIKFKCLPLSESNNDCLPRRIGFQTMAKIDGIVKGQYPIYTEAVLPNILGPSLTPVTTGIPLTPFGPVMGVPALAVSQPNLGYGMGMGMGLGFPQSNSICDRVDKALERVKILTSIEQDLTCLKDMKEEQKKNIAKKYFEFVDLSEPINSLGNIISINDIKDELEKIKNRNK